MSQTIKLDDFKKCQIATGTIVEAKLNTKARVPAYILTINFGELGVKISSAQVTEHYTIEGLIGMQVVAVMNFEPKRVAGVKSEVLVLASMSEQDGTVLLTPTKHVANGALVS